MSARLRWPQEGHHRRGKTLARPLLSIFVGVRPVIRHPAIWLLFSIAPCCWPFLSTFLPPLPFLDLSSHNPPILAVVFLVFYNLLVSLSRIFSVISYLVFRSDHASSPFHPTFNYFANYTSFSSNFFSRSLILFLSPLIASEYICMWSPHS